MSVRDVSAGQADDGSEILLSELLGSEIVDDAGNRLGRIYEVRVGSLQRPHVRGLLAGRASLRRRLFGERPDAGRQPPKSTIVSWEDVGEIRGRSVIVHAGKGRP